MQFCLIPACSNMGGVPIRRENGATERPCNNSGSIIKMINNNGEWCAAPAHKYIIDANVVVVIKKRRGC